MEHSKDSEYFLPAVYMEMSPAEHYSSKLAIQSALLFLSFKFVYTWWCNSPSFWRQTLSDTSEGGGKFPPTPSSSSVFVLCSAETNDPAKWRSDVTAWAE